MGFFTSLNTESDWSNYSSLIFINILCWFCARASKYCEIFWRAKQELNYNVNIFTSPMSSDSIFLCLNCTFEPIKFLQIETNTNKTSVWLNGMGKK